MTKMIKSFLGKVCASSDQWQP